jgi:tetratricopeptide (TPR) repeat protein
VRSAEAAEGAERKAALKKSAGACRRAIGYAKGLRPGLPEALRLQGTHEWLSGRTAAARRWWSQSLDVAASIGNRYDTAATHLEVGGRLGDRATLERAEDILTHIGAKFDAGRASRLLGELALQQRQVAEARTRFERSIALLKEVRAENELALAYAGYGRLHKQQRHTGEARDYLTRALETFERLETPKEAARVRAELASLPAS